jgi:hypothetical protein
LTNDLEISGPGLRLSGVVGESSFFAISVLLCLVLLPWSQLSEERRLITC